jgi:hypothetical protein
LARTRIEAGIRDLTKKELRISTPAINNPFTKRSVRIIVERAGYKCPEFYSPDELMETVK